MMDWLTPKDWADLRLAGTSVIAVMLIAPLIGLFFRWRRKQPLFTWPKLRELIDSSWIILLLIFMGPAGDVAQRHGWSKNAIFAASMLFIGAASLLAFRGHMKTMREAANAHGVANPAAGPAEKVPLSAEEKQLQKKLWIGMALFAAIPIGLMLALPWAIGPVMKSQVALTPDHRPDTSRLMVLFFAFGGLLATMIYAMVGRWPFPHTKTSQVDIAATPQAIWDTITYCEGRENWKGIYGRIDRVPGFGESYQLHYLPTENCAECGLPKQGQESGITTRVEVIEARAPDYYQFRSYPKGQTQMKGKAENWLDYEDESFTITPLPGGGSSVTHAFTMTRPKIWLFLMVLFGSKLSQTLKSVKAHLEGTPDTSLYGTAVARRAAARAAPVHCGCPATGFALAA
jgi:hypothetical protein